MPRRIQYKVWAHMRGDVKEVYVVLLAHDNMDAMDQFRAMMDKLGLMYFHAYAEKAAGD